MNAYISGFKTYLKLFRELLLRWDSLTHAQRMNKFDELSELKGKIMKEG